jgi:hypothetical protein
VVSKVEGPAASADVEGVEEGTARLQVTPPTLPCTALRTAMVSRAGVPAAAAEVKMNEWLSGLRIEVPEQCCSPERPDTEWESGG